MVKNKKPYILAVDLDNTLIKTDMIYVGLKFLLIYRIYLLPKLIWLFLSKGKTYAKKYLFDITSYSVENIIFNQSVIEYEKKLQENKINHDEILDIKTKEFNKFLLKNKLENALIISDTDSMKNINKSARNIKNIKLIKEQGTNIFDLFKYKNVIITSSSAKKIQQRILNEKN